jgi:hypothetical protein
MGEGDRGDSSFKIDFLSYKGDRFRLPFFLWEGDNG